MSEYVQGTTVFFFFFGAKMDVILITNKLVQKCQPTTRIHTLSYSTSSVRHIPNSQGSFQDVSGDTQSMRHQVRLKDHLVPTVPDCLYCLIEEDLPASIKCVRLAWFTQVRTDPDTWMVLPP